jgi:uncharacterized membrane protein YgcG
MKWIFSLLLGIGFWSAVHAQDFIINDFEIAIKVHKEGHIDVNEKISVFFNEKRRGIIREIPYTYQLAGKEYTTPIRNIKVLNHPSKVSKNGSVRAIRIGDPNKYLSGPVQYDIRYEVEGPFITNTNYDEFYWNLTGNEWTAPIEKVRFDIELPDEFPIPYSDLKLYSGSTGSQADSGYIQQEGKHIRGQNMARLEPGEGMTISIKLPYSYIDRRHVADLTKTALQETMEEVKWQSPWAVIPAALISLFVGFWNKKRKRFTPENLKESMPYPPDDMTPAEVGGFYDQIIHDRDVVSLLPYWAAQGFIRMEYNPHTKDSHLIRLHDLSGDRAAYEYSLFRNLFATRDTVSLSELKYKFHPTLSLVKSMISKEIIDQQLYDEDYRYWFRSWRGWLVVVLMIPLAVLFFILGYWLAGAFFLMGFLVGMVLLLQPQVVSQKGYRIKLHLQAFYRFLKGDADDQMEQLIKENPNYFDQVYPYAVAFNLDKSFIKRIQPYRNQAPTWYGYYGIPMVMNRSDHSMEAFGREFETKEITSAFNSVSPPSSTGSGSIGSGGGGGFSGGGFGGGGGSSW